MTTPTKMLLATHNGPFHADDLMCCVILKMLGLCGPVSRTRDPNELDSADIVFDVGGIYDPHGRRFDHHQKGGAGTRPNGVPYAAVGLIWRAYGLEFCARYAEDHGIDAEELWEAIDVGVIQGLDATDCGALEGVRTLKGSGNAVATKSLSDLVAAFNPAPLIEGGSPEDFDQAFLRAVEAVTSLFERLVLSEVSRLKARAVVESCDRGGPILLLDQFCPWQEAVGKIPHVVFVVFPTSTGQWNCQVVPQEAGSRTPRKNLPEAWAGLKDAELAALTGVADAVFCHNGRFICGANTEEGALRLAELALHSP